MSEDAIYDAGLFDGEGNVYIAWSRQRNVALRATLTNTAFEIVARFQRRYGGAIRTDDPRASRLGKRICYQWSSCNATAGAFLRTIEPHLIIKKRQALLGIEFAEQMAAYVGWKKKLPILEVLSRQAAREAMVVLNGQQDRERANPFHEKNIRTLLPHPLRVG